MAKPVQAATISPLSIALGSDVLTEDAVEVLGQLNYAFAKRFRLHVSAFTGIDDWAAPAMSIGTTRSRFPAAASYREALRFNIKVRPEVIQIACAFECFFDAGNEGDVQIEIGAATLGPISFTSGDNGSPIVTLANTSLTGTGDLECVVSLRRTLGASADNYLRHVRIEDVEIAAANIPGPNTD